MRAVSVVRRGAGGLLVLLLAGCGPKHPHVPPLGAVAPLTEQEARGEAVFARVCHSCHPNGGAGFGPSTLLPPRVMVPIQVRLGLGAMPAFSRTELPPDDLKALVAWIARLDAEK